MRALPPYLQVMADEKPKFVLKYFDFQGRAEPIRYIFAHAGVEYVDERVPVERWAELKKSFPFGVLPVLELGGAHVLAGSTAIARYLAERVRSSSSRRQRTGQRQDFLRRGCSDGRIRACGEAVS